tara:strand:+ start:365 stop:1585 length:1221 start_codon:yes stop_codon:yes gene_type:complete
MNYLEEFIKRKNRIIYGGWAWHNLLILKNKNEHIYHKDRISYPDIEFYSPDPIGDLIEICNYLYDKKCKFVQGHEGEHHETYKLFVNFINLCDISYVPKIIMNKLPYIKINNIQFIHPKFITIDILRMYTDPLTSYWRIKKNLLRANKLLSYWPLKIQAKFQTYSINKETNKVLDFIRKNILPNNEHIVFGYYAYEYYKNIDQKDNNLFIPYYDIISYNLKDNCLKIKNLLSKFNIVIEEYHPFFQFMDQRVSFKFNGKIVLNVYGNNSKCTPYKIIKSKNINICSFQFLLMTLLIIHFYHKFYNNRNEFNNMDFMLKNIINIRNKYLKNKNKTIIDDTPYQDFIIQCKGSYINSHREWQIGIKKKIKQKKRIKFIYDPSRKKLTEYKYNFKNSSGRINTSNYKLI